MNQRTQIYNSPNYPISPAPRIINCQIIQPSQPRRQIIINETNITTNNNILVNVVKQNQNRRQNHIQMNNRQSNTRNYNSSQQNSQRLSQNYPTVNNIAPFKSSQEIKKPQKEPQLDNIQENYPEKKDIQNYDPQFTKPVVEKKTISFHNVKDNDSNNIDSDSRTISNDNENAAPSIRNNLHRNFK